MVKTKKQSKITNKNHKGGNNQNVIVEIHIGEDKKELKGKIKDEEKEELIKKLNEVEIAYNELKEDKEIVEKAVNVNVPVNIPSFPTQTNDKGQILESIMNMKNKIDDSKEELQLFITENQEEMDNQYKELLYNRGYNVDLQQTQENQEVQKIQPIITRGAEGTSPPDNLNRDSEDIGGNPRGRKPLNIPNDVYENAVKYIENGLIPLQFSNNNKDGVIFSNKNQLLGALQQINKGNSPDIIRKAFDRLSLKKSPSQINQKDIIEEIDRIKTNDNKGITDIKGNKVYTEEDSRTPKEQQKDKALTKIKATEAVEELKNLRNMDDELNRQENLKREAYNILGQEDNKLIQLNKTGNQESIKKQEQIRAYARNQYQQILKNVEDLNIKIRNANNTYNKKYHSTKSTVKVKTDDSGLNYRDGDSAF